MNKICKNCQTSFEITSDDQAFYARLAVPAPTLCPLCRFQRRLAWKNTNTFYRRACDLCKKEGISIFPTDAPYRVYCTKCWWSDAWDPLEYGREYDASRSFFDQFEEMLHDAPQMALTYDYPKNVNSPYVNECGPVKNCYLLLYGDECENSMVGYYQTHTKDVLDCALLTQSTFCYDCRNGLKENYGIGLQNTNETLSSYFLRDARNCKDCFGSANIKNKRYVFFNEQLTQEEYERKLGEIDLGSHAMYLEMKRKAFEHWKKFPPRPIWLDFSVNTTGNYAFESKNCAECYEVTGVEDSKYIAMALSGPVRNCMDVSGWGNNLELSYECCVVGENASRMMFCQEAGLSSLDCEYSKLFMNSSNLFGCISMRNKRYCILNKQYSKKEFEVLREKIIADMKKRGEWGEFFPMHHAPHAYNETIAYEFAPLSKEETLAKGLRWRETERHEYDITMRANALPDHISDATELILKQVIECDRCGRGFRITQMEFDFLKHMRVPLPRQCPFCRIKEKLQAWVKQLKLTDRTCGKCGVAFRTPYTNEEYPDILCIECWKAQYA